MSFTVPSTEDGCQPTEPEPELFCYPAIASSLFQQLLHSTISGCSRLRKGQHILYPYPVIHEYLLQMIDRRVCNSPRAINK